MLVEEDETFIIKKTRRDYVVIRKEFPYEFHSHFDSYDGCRKIIKLFKDKIIPDSEYFQVAMQRITTDYEYEKFHRKPVKQKYRNRR